MDLRQTLHGWRTGTAGSQALADCCLIIPTYRRPTEMVTLLQLLTKLPDAPAEVVVVDGSSDAATNDAVGVWAAELGLPFELRFVRSPAGLTRQRNVGLDASTKEFVFFLDDDCLPEPGYFREMRAAFHDARIGAVRGFIINGVDLPVPGMWRLRLKLGIVDAPVAGRYFPTGMTWTWNQTGPFTGTRPVDVLAGGAAAYRRAVFAKHRFSEFFAGYSFGEDLEMSRRVAEDWTMVVCGNARVDHHHAEGGRPGGFTLGRMVLRNRYFIWRRHSPKVGWGVRFKFWLDQALVAGKDFACFVRAPRHIAHLQRVLGTLYGTLECWVAPPQYQEPPARQEYEIVFEPVPAK